jgi:hypothetical protein
LEESQVQQQRWEMEMHLVPVERDRSSPL